MGMEKYTVFSRLDMIDSGPLSLGFKHCYSDKRDSTLNSKARIAYSVHAVLLNLFPRLLILE